MDALAWGLLGGSALLAIHLVAVPLAKRRSVLIRGAEAYVIWSLAIASAGVVVTWLFALLAVQAIVAWALSPWLVVGVRGAGVAAAAARAAGMIRLTIEPSGQRTTRLGTSATMTTISLGPLVNLVTFSVRRTSKVELLRNVFRKTIQNLAWGVA